MVTRFPNVRFHRFVTRETIDGTNPSNERWRELAGYPDALELNRMVLEPRSTPTYLCGPQPMMDAMQSLLVEAGFAKDRIFTEVFESPQGSEVQVGPSANRVSGHATQEASVPSTVVFQRSMAELALEPEQSILEGAENGGIALPFECRSGICGQCKVKCTEGRVRMEVTDALSKWEHDAGYILACQAKALDSRIVIEA
jgi:ferredoxin